MSQNIDDALHQQEMDFKMVNMLLPFVQNKNFLDIGAEKGTFTTLLASQGFTGIFFEPLPKHEEELNKLAQDTNCIFSKFAIDRKDGEADFHIACDSDGKQLDYFHSLQYLENDARVHHNQTIRVNCRSIESLCNEGLIQKQIGIIKTDTEGNDLQVLRGIGNVRAEILVCEFFMPGIYSGWEQGDPNALIEEAKKIGFNNFIAIKRIDELETLSLNTTEFLDKQWGNLIFLNDEIYKKVKLQIIEVLAANETQSTKTFINRITALNDEITTLRKACDERLSLINNLTNNVKNKNMSTPIINDHPTNIQARLINLESSNKEILSFLDQINATEQDTVARQEIQNKLISLENHQINLNSFNKTLYETNLQAIRTQDELFNTMRATLTDLHAKYLDLLYKKNRFSLLFRKTLAFKALKKIKARLKIFLAPKLGELNLYSPKSIILPKSYSKKSKHSNLPTISIVTPGFNHGAFIERTIKSIITQNYDKLEYVVQDGGSKDKTCEILQRYDKYITHWESVKDNGQSQAINLGFRHTTGEIMAYLNSDDLLMTGSLDYVGKFFKENPDVDVLYSHRILINEADEEIGRWILPKHDSDILSWADYVPQETLFWRRSIWDKIGGKIDESFSFAMDWDLLLRFRDAGAKFARVPRFLGAFRIHPHQKTSSEISQTGIEEMQRLRHRCHEKEVCTNEIRNGIKSYLNRHIVYHKLYRLGILRY